MCMYVGMKAACVAAQGGNQDLFPKIVFQVRVDLYKTLHGGSFELIPRLRGQTQPELFTFGANPVQLLLNEMNKTFCSDFDVSGTSRLETIKCGANLVSDQKVGFSQNLHSQQNLDFNPVQPQIR